MANMVVTIVFYFSINYNVKMYQRLYKFELCQEKKQSFKFWSRVNAIKSGDIWNKAIRGVPNWKSNIPFRVPNSRTVPLESEWRESSRILRGCRNLVGFNFRNAKIHTFFHNLLQKARLINWLHRTNMIGYVCVQI